MNIINVKSEYGKLKKVLLHRPGYETENLTPSNYEELLFDDSYYLAKAQEEHDEFAQVFRDNGVEVVYLEDLIAQVLDKDSKVKEKFLKQFINEAGVDEDTTLFATILNYLKTFKNNKDLVLKLMEGLRYSELPKSSNPSLEELAEYNVFVMKPMPNLIFTRDPFASIGNGISLHSMYYETRKRETIFADYIFKFHPEYKGVERYYDRDQKTSIEGGDVMILSEEAIAVGISQRTEPASVERLAKNLFNSNKKIKVVYGVDIPKGRSWMHLDTVFTQIDKNKFAIFSNYKFGIFKISKEAKGIKIESYKKDISEIMSEVFKEKNVQLIKCGLGDPIHSEREQWNDGSNVLAIAPNTVIAYNRNHVTNKALRDAGVNVLEISSSELSRGRGGPRCMSMPLIREEI